MTPASFEPTIDYVVVKIPRFTFEKFPGTEALADTSMKSVGEAMAIGRYLPRSLQKALRSMETGLTGLNEIEIRRCARRQMTAMHQGDLPSRTRPVLTIAQAMRYGMSLKKSCAAPVRSVVPWPDQSIVDPKRTDSRQRPATDAHGMARLKTCGFSDARLARLIGQPTHSAGARLRLNVKPVYKRIDTCAAEFASQTSYMYGCYEGEGLKPECEAEPRPDQSRDP